MKNKETPIKSLRSSIRAFLQVNLRGKGYQSTGDKALPDSPSPEPPSHRFFQKHQSIMRILLLVLIVAGIGAAILYRDHLDAQLLAQWIEDAGAAGPLLFILIYAVGTVVFLPGSVLTLAGGALFGPVLGALYNLIGATIGATLAFLIARYLASDWVERKTGGRLKRLKDGVEQEGWRFVAFVRLVPLFPYNLLNYALGLTRLRLTHYIFASFLFMLPGALAYTYLGYAGREAISGGEYLIQKGLLALALLATAAFMPRFIGKWRHTHVETKQHNSTNLKPTGEKR